jgi:alkylation response protein AidB-like acyl-CoA dehydrogenase
MAARPASTRIECSSPSATAADMENLPHATSPTPALILQVATEITDDVLRPAAMAVEASGEIPAEHLDLLAARGFYGLAGPREADGLNADQSTAWRVIEILASGCLSTTFVWLQHNSAVRAVTASNNRELRERWLAPLCRGQRRAGLALAGAVPGPPMLRAEPATGGYVLDGFSPWVTGWGLIDSLHVAARDPGDNVVWVLLDAKAGPGLSVEPLNMVAVMATRTVRANFQEYFVSADQVTATMPLAEWQRLDAANLRANGSLALGVAASCCAAIGPGPLDDELKRARAALDAATAATMPAARAAAAELAMRAATAHVVSAGSTAILLTAQAQRLAREAMFLLVFASRPTIKDSLAGLLVQPGQAR